MSEFKNRIKLQRKTLQVVNSSKIYKESLLSLSNSAINRWATKNRIGDEDKTISIIKIISKKLFFLANKSQEQITEDYSNKTDEIEGLLEQLKQIASQNK